MKAIRIHQFGDASTLKLEEIPRLSIADDQILIRIRDAGVNPIDWKIRQGYGEQGALSEEIQPSRATGRSGRSLAG